MQLSYVQCIAHKFIYKRRSPISKQFNFHNRLYTLIKILLLVLIYKSFPHAQSNQSPLHSAGLHILFQVMSRPDLNLDYIEICKWSPIRVQSNYTLNMGDHQPSPVTTIRALMLLTQHIKANKQHEIQSIWSSPSHICFERMRLVYTIPI